MTSRARTVLWWGHFDPDYSRNRILRQLFRELGWTITDFHPRFSTLGHWEARLRRLPAPDLVFVPCFRQRDIVAAARYARRHGRPLMIDPLISAYDKQVFERGKLSETSHAAQRLLAWECAGFAAADSVLADTDEHARFFRETLAVDPARLQVVPVGAEEALFSPGPPRPPASPLEVLFYGSFIPLQGPEVIVEAARLYEGPPVRWVLLGNGPLRSRCEALATGLTNVRFEDWVPYPQLPARIRRADILLGIFGVTPKAGRVMPNKFFQALACGKPLITRSSPAYPAALRDNPDTGIAWTAAGDARALARAVAQWAQQAPTLPQLGQQAQATYQRLFSNRILRTALDAALRSLNLPD